MLGATALVLGLIAAPGAFAQEAVTCLDLATFTEEPATIVGTNGSDILRGTPGRDVIAGLDGNDIILGLGGPAEPSSFDICNGLQGTDLAVPATCELEIQIEGDFVPPTGG
jgi:Ca2+-binding RTX toxin-like protein